MNRHIGCGHHVRVPVGVQIQRRHIDDGGSGREMQRRAQAELPGIHDAVAAARRPAVRAACPGQRVGIGGPIVANFTAGSVENAVAAAG
jgi:hypothetical protein